MKMTTAEDFYDGAVRRYTAKGVPGALLAYEKLHVDRLDKVGVPLPPRCMGNVKTPVAEAYVNRGRWVAMCPFGCGSAQVLSSEDRRFYCCGAGGCFNEKAQFRAVPVKWPAEKTLLEVERLLEVRPFENRNWEVGETVKDLKVDNITHGVAV